MKTSDDFSFSSNSNTYYLWCQIHLWKWFVLAGEGLCCTSAQGRAPGFMSLCSSCFWDCCCYSCWAANWAFAPLAELWVGLISVSGTVAVGITVWVSWSCCWATASAYSWKIKIRVFCFSCCFLSHLFACLLIAFYFSYCVEEDNIWYHAYIDVAFIWFQQKTVWLINIFRWYPLAGVWPYYQDSSKVLICFLVSSLHCLNYHLLCYKWNLVNHPCLINYVKLNYGSSETFSICLHCGITQTIFFKTQNNWSFVLVSLTVLVTCLCSPKGFIQYLVMIFHLIGFIQLAAPKFCEAVVAICISHGTPS